MHLVPRPEVLVLSASPRAHHLALHALRQRGLSVQSAGARERAMHMLRRRPVLVLVDLVHTADLTRDVVRAINDLRGPSYVVALHDGRLTPIVPALEELSVDGFCHTTCWEPLAACAPLVGMGNPNTVH